LTEKIAIFGYSRDLDRTARYEMPTMVNTLKLEIVTPDGIVVSQNVEMVTLPGSEGQMGILPLHIPLMAQVVPGEIIVRTGDTNQYLAIGEGLVEITGNAVSILTDMAVAVENIDEAKAEEEQQRAEDRLKEKLSTEEVASVQAALARSMAEVNVKRQHQK
jgi:F-type H+-transporting ATPase subunit epsilon